MSETKAPPVKISPDALYALSNKVRQWTGWRDANLRFGKPIVSPWAECNRATHTITADPEHLILNPNRVLFTVTPFRLRQEAVLTGALLHEAAHARYTHWLPTSEEVKTKPVLHSDGSEPTKQVIALAKTMEEPRIEGLMARDERRVGATGLGWTMRASAAYLLPSTELSDNPAQAIMDLITSWALRAGRQGALNYFTGHHFPGWVNQFTSLVHQAIETHLTECVNRGADLKGDTPNYRSLGVLAVLNEMIRCEDNTGPTMIDKAREALDLLFPETEDDGDDGSSVMAGGGCGTMSEAESGQQGDGSEDGSDGEGNTEPEDEGIGDDPGAGDFGDDDEGGPEDESADQDGDGAEDQPDAEDQSDAGKPGDEDSEAEAEDDSARSSTDTDSAIAKLLARIESSAQSQIEGEAEEAAAQVPDPEEGDSGATGASAGIGGSMGGSWRKPSKNEREVQRRAERFLRDLIDASETSKRTLTDQPSAMVDGAAMSAWKAGGQVREPHFFVRTNRTIEPSPPIKIAILVDVSASMDNLQRPSSLLSWSLAAAALDLRNFAGRGQRVESCLIHWGDDVRVIQRPGEVLPGVREFPCKQGTSAMHEALDEVEKLMPGFYDVGDKPVNRLIVQFTDWKLFGVRGTTERISHALSAGVNMLSVVPRDYSARYARLSEILQACPVQRGRNSLVKYDYGNPEQVWENASDMLLDAASGKSVAPFPGF